MPSNSGDEVLLPVRGSSGETLVTGVDGSVVLPCGPTGVVTCDGVVVVGGEVTVVGDTLMLVVVSVGGGATVVDGGTVVVGATVVVTPFRTGGAVVVGGGIVVVGAVVVGVQSFSVCSDDDSV